MTRSRPSPTATSSGPSSSDSLASGGSYADRDGGPGHLVPIAGSESDVVAETGGDHARVRSLVWIRRGEGTRQHAAKRHRAVRRERQDRAPFHSDQMKGQGGTSA